VFVLATRNRFQRGTRQAQVSTQHRQRLADGEIPIAEDGVHAVRKAAQPSAFSEQTRNPKVCLSLQLAMAAQRVNPPAVVGRQRPELRKMKRVHAEVEDILHGRPPGHRWPSPNSSNQDRARFPRARRNR
jgi:hypothetical protein